MKSLIYFIVFGDSGEGSLNVLQITTFQQGAVHVGRGTYSLVYLCAQGTQLEIGGLLICLCLRASAAFVASLPALILK